MTILAQLHRSGRSLPRLLRDAFVLWSPLALVIVILAFAAGQLARAGLQFVYAVTTLDEFCAVRGQGGAVIPCTGMHGVLAADAVRPLGPQADIERFTHARFRAARQRLIPAAKVAWRDAAQAPSTLQAAVSPAAVLGLDRAPEDDPELVRLKQELRRLMRPAAPRTVLEMVQQASLGEERARRIRLLSGRVAERRALVNRAAFRGLGAPEQERLRLRNRIAYWLAREPVRLDAATLAALDRLGQDEDDAGALARARAGVARTLARSEGVALHALARQAGEVGSAAALYDAFGIRALCTVASTDDRLRLRADDFELGAGDRGRLAGNAGAFTCFHVPATGLALESLGFRESVSRSIDRWHAQTARSASARIGALARRGVSTEAQAQAARSSLMQVVPAGIHLGRQKCGWLHPLNCVANAARESVEDGYAGLVTKLSATPDRRDGTAGALAVDTEVGTALAELDGRLDAMRVAAHDYAARFFLAADLARWLGWLLLALIVVKSFLYVLALEVFHSDQRLAIGFDDVAPVQGSYRVGRRLSIDPAFPHAMVTRKQLSNSDNNVDLAPWPLSSPIARLLRGRYFIFSRGRLLEDAGHADAAGAAERGMVASAGSGMSMVEWTLREGEEVVFRYQDFFGASENVELRSRISLKLSTLLLGRVVFHIARCASGEGRLLLRADVEDIDQSRIRALPPERLIAWNRHARFTVHSGRTPWKTLLNGFTLVRQERPEGPDGLLLVSSEDAGSSLGSIRFVRRIFSAIF